MANTYTYEATAERKEWSKQVKVVRLGERGFCIMCLLFFMRKVQNGDATKKLQKDIYILFPNTRRRESDNSALTTHYKTLYERTYTLASYSFLPSFSAIPDSEHDQKV